MRKFTVRFTVWSAYLMADWVATVALGVISQNTLDDSPKNERQKLQYELMAFWATFLLLHLGGPDTITAYSVEDNELWLRHLLGLAVHSGLAVYVLIAALPGPSYLIPCSLLILLSGIIKYSERTLALRSAKVEYLGNPIPTTSNYAIFMDEYIMKKMQGFFVEVVEAKELPVRTDRRYPDGGRRLISEAFDLFENFKVLFGDLILSFQDRDDSRSYFLRNLGMEEEEKRIEESAKKAFDVIDIELSFAFDMFFTKAPIIYTAGCCILRLITVCFTSVSMITFSLLCERKQYQVADVVITYLLFGVAILLEFYAVYVLINSDWMDHWLSKHNKSREVWISKCLKLSDKPRWSNSMSQYNLLGFCLDDKPSRFFKIQKFFHIADFLEKHRYRTNVEVSSGLKTQIFNHFKATKDDFDYSTLVNRRGSFTIQGNNYSELDWPLESDFDERIVMWHIATDLCYHLDSEGTSVNKEESKHLSDYMLYLQVMCPFMLPTRMGMITFRDTCAAARDVFQERKLKRRNKLNVCKILMSVNTEVLPNKVIGRKSVLFDACRLAKSLRKIEEGRRWKIIFHELVELAAYAATHCRSNHHAQQLRKGGEFLTHVWLLMAHLGLTGQFQIAQGHRISKLIAE